MVYNNLKIDLNSNLAASNDKLTKTYDDSDTDTTLRLECSGYGGSRSNSKGQNSKTAPKDGSTLVLGYGPTPSTCSSGINKKKKQADEDSVLELSFSYHSSTSKSALNPFSNHYSQSFEANDGFGVSVFNDGSTSSTKSGGYIPSLLLAPRIRTTTNKRLLQRSEISVGWLEKPAKRRQLIPPEVLVPPSMKLKAFSSFTLNSDRKKDGESGTNGTGGLVVPEGRVHGGSLLSLLGGNLRDAVIDGI